MLFVETAMLYASRGIDDDPPSHNEHSERRELELDCQQTPARGVIM